MFKICKKFFFKGRKENTTKGFSTFRGHGLYLINIRQTHNKIFHNLNVVFLSAKLLEHSVLRTFTAQGGMSGLNYIDSLDKSKSRCGCPTQAKFHIFQVRQSDRSTNRTPPSIQACAVNWKHQYKYIVN